MISSYLRSGLCEEKLLRHLTSVGLHLVSAPDLTARDMVLLAATFSKALDARQLDSDLPNWPPVPVEPSGLRGPALYWVREVLNQVL